VSIDLTCPVCGAAIAEGKPVVVCGSCHGSLTGDISARATGEFHTPTAAALDAADGSRRSRPFTAPGAELCCTWCGKAASEVKKLLTSGTANICDECIALCSDILTAELGDDWQR
jgi:hypothetical protein